MILLLVIASIWFSAAVSIKEYATQDLSAAELANMTTVSNTWQSARLQTVSAAINAQSNTSIVNEKIQAIVDYQDATVNPLNILSLQNIEQVISSAVPIPAYVVASLNDTTDILPTPIQSLTDSFNYTLATAYPIQSTELGNYIHPGENFAIFVQ